MIRPLKLDQWSDANVSLMHHRLEEDSVGVSRNLRTQPAEVRANAQPPRIVPVLRNLHIALLAQGTPDTPSERAVCVSDWNLQASSDVKTPALVALYLALLSSE